MTKFLLFATIHSKAVKNSFFEALEIEYYSEVSIIEAEEEAEAVKAFQESSIYGQFSVNHASQTVYTFVKSDGDVFYHRADQSPAATSEE